jgi:uncharacterized protein YidB (DUF937 family)
MFDNILGIVKQHVGNDPQVSSSIPPGREDAVHQEIAHGVTNGLKDNITGGGIGGMVSSLTGGHSGADSSVSQSVSKAVAERLNGKFGLSSDAIQKITSAIPAIIQKVTNKG